MCGVITEEIAQQQGVSKTAIHQTSASAPSRAGLPGARAERVWNKSVQGRVSGNQLIKELRN